MEDTLALFSSIAEGLLLRNYFLLKIYRKVKHCGNRPRDKGFSFKNV